MPRARCSAASRRRSWIPRWSPPSTVASSKSACTACAWSPHRRSTSCPTSRRCIASTRVRARRASRSGRAGGRRRARHRRRRPVLRRRSGELARGRRQPRRVLALDETRHQLPTPGSHGRLATSHATHATAFGADFQGFVLRLEAPEQGRRQADRHALRARLSRRPRGRRDSSALTAALPGRNRP